MIQRFPTPGSSMRRLLGTATTILWLTSLGGPVSAAETPVDAAAERALGQALERHDWKAAASLAAEQGRLHPEDKYWPSMLALARMRFALEQAARVRQSSAALSAEEQQSLRTLSTSVRQWTAQPAEKRESELPPLLLEVKRFALSHPDLPSGWILEAQMTLLANRGLEGRIAARNLEELKAWETDSLPVLELLGRLQVVGWMPAAQASEPQRQGLAALAEQVLMLGTAPDTNAEKLQVLLSQVKSFCRDNETLPNGWLLQYHLASQLGRKLEQSVAKSKLAKTRARQAPAPAPPP